ncbi:hypothetical protein MFU01_29760 [Myxococcus fulvus]|uniref:Uncharacterized protein n=1 Tax=Myxococcus fulvus TaxID=33 RepID=A0A511T1A3_MYXFU|nr:hypothetical protein MFU01_29760 [Myxococcus fulvus]
MGLWGSACATVSPVRPLAPDGDYGTRAPFIFQAAAPDGRWILACQAREDTDQDGKVEVRFDPHGGLMGDLARPYLFLEPGEGLAVDDVLTWDSEGRRLVLLSGGAIRLLDTTTNEETRLGDWSDEDAETKAPRPPMRASFSRDGQRLLYLRREGARTVTVLREVSSGEERQVDTGPGLLGQAFLHPDGHWMVFDVVAKDTDQDGALKWPQEQTTLAPARCRGLVLSSSYMGFHGDQPVRRFQRIEGGPNIEGEDILRPVGEGLLRRAPDGALLFEDEDGDRETWVPASCKAHLLAVDAPREQLIVGCDAREGLADLELHGASRHLRLGRKVFIEAGRLATDDPRPRLLAVYATSSAGVSMQDADLDVLDLERRTLTTHSPESRWITGLGAQALLLEEETSTSRLWLWNAETGQKQEVGEVRDGSYDRVGDHLFYRGWLMDLGAGQVLGPLEDEPETIDTRGRALHFLQPRPDGTPGRRAASWGPVRWRPAVTTK